VNLSSTSPSAGFRFILCALEKDFVVDQLIDDVELEREGFFLRRFLALGTDARAVILIDFVPLDFLAVDDGPNVNAGGRGFLQPQGKRAVKKRAAGKRRGANEEVLRKLRLRSGIHAQSLQGYRPLSGFFDFARANARVQTFTRLRAPDTRRERTSDSVQRRRGYCCVADYVAVVGALPQYSHFIAMILLLLAQGLSEQPGTFLSQGCKNNPDRFNKLNCRPASIAKD